MAEGTVDHAKVMIVTLYVVESSAQSRGSHDQEN
jgi:hypothetical protein